MTGKTIVLAENLDDVVVITPRTLNRARGVVGREVLVAKGIAGQPGHRDLWDAIAPCFATTHIGPLDELRPGDHLGDDGLLCRCDDAETNHSPESAVSGREDE